MRIPAVVYIYVLPRYVCTGATATPPPAKNTFMDMYQLEVQSAAAPILLPYQQYLGSAHHASALSFQCMLTEASDLGHCRQVWRQPAAVLSAEWLSVEC